LTRRGRQAPLNRVFVADLATIPGDRVAIRQAGAFVFLTRNDDGPRFRGP
jgi:hypothetical protein